MNMPPACPHPAHIQPPIRHHPSSLPAIPDWADCRAAGSRARRFRQAISVGVAVALLVGRAVHAEPVGTGGVHVETDSFAATVTEDARRSGLPVSWIQAVMQAEGAGDARAVSPKGAMGLMKIMPETWASLRLCYGLGADPFDPHDNIVAGAAYLRELHDRYGSPDFLAAYNAGPARYEDHVATGRPLPAETRAYVGNARPADRQRRDRRHHGGHNRRPFLDRCAAVHRTIGGPFSDRAGFRPMRGPITVWPTMARRI
jgi:soluble lytic murein transglycosylase-like protein